MMKVYFKFKKEDGNYFVKVKKDKIEEYVFTKKLNSYISVLKNGLQNIQLER